MYKDYIWTAFFVEVRFEHEELELNKFVKEIIIADIPGRADLRSTSELLNFLRRTDHAANVSCPNSCGGSPFETPLRRLNRKLSDTSRHSRIPSSQRQHKHLGKSDQQNKAFDPIPGSDPHISKQTRRSTHEPSCRTQPNFIFSFETDSSNHFFIRSFDKLDKSDPTASEEDYEFYLRKYEDYQKIAHMIKYVGFAVLSVMVFEVGFL